MYVIIDFLYELLNIFNNKFKIFIIDSSYRNRNNSNKITVLKI